MEFNALVLLAVGFSGGFLVGAAVFSVLALRWFVNQDAKRMPELE